MFSMPEVSFSGEDKALCSQESIDLTEISHGNLHFFSTMASAVQVSYYLLTLG